MIRRNTIVWSIIIIPLASVFACNSGFIFPSGSKESPASPAVHQKLDRETKIPTTAIKMSPGTDAHPPILLSDEFEKPVPIPGNVNTAGAEDSPFITPDGNTLFFFFTPDVNIPAEKQLLDAVTGIYVSHKVDGEWSKAERIYLQDPGKLALDGCEFVLDDLLWFCSIREGFTEINWFTAEYRDGTWQNWKLADFKPDYKVGELHLTSGGTELYFGSERAGGMGKLDLWVSNKLDGEWQDPVNLSVLNTTDDEGWPAVNPDGDELWFYRNYGIWRSKKVNGAWQAAEPIVSTLAGEPSIDREGNLFFVHHYFINDKMIEADIFVAYRK